MWPLIGTMVALGVSANEPSALLVVLVVLRSGRDRGVAFVVGWVAALGVVAVGAGFAMRIGLGPRQGGPRRITLVVELIIGVGLVVFAVWYWWRGRNGAHATEEPHILRRLTSIGLIPATIAGVATATYPPAIVAGTTLFRSDASTAARIVALSVFLGVGTVMVAAPVVGMYAAPNWTTHHMDRMYGWTLRHRRILLTVILGAVGLFIAVRAVHHLVHYH
jgi:hypothetical protein